VVRGVHVDMRVANLRSGADHECGAELVDPLTALHDAKAIAVGPERPFEATGVKQQGGEVHLSDRGRAGRGGDIVDQDVERDSQIGDKGLRVAHVTRSDRHDLAAGFTDLVVGVSQLRGMFSTEQSAEVAQKDQDYGTVGPELAQAVLAAVSTDELDPRQPFEIHPDKMPHPRTRRPAPRHGPKGAE
jgi:hypothetical protein